MTVHRTLPLSKPVSLVVLCMSMLCAIFVKLFRKDGFVMGSAPVTETCWLFGITQKEMAAWLTQPLSAVGDEMDAGRKR